METLKVYELIAKIKTMPIIELKKLEAQIVTSDYNYEVKSKLLQEVGERLGDFKMPDEALVEVSAIDGVE